MIYEQGQHLTEVIFEFKASKVTIRDAFDFLDELIETIKVEQTTRFLNKLPPGFDVLCGLKESCIYFGSWPEHEYNRLIVSSCRHFKHSKIIPLIEKYFSVNIGETQITINSDESIKKKVKNLWA